MQTALYGKINERKGEWLVGANTQKVLYLSIVATEQKARQRRVRHVRRVRCVGARARKVRNLADS